MNKYTVTFLFALLVVLASVTLRRSFASSGDPELAWKVTTIGVAPVPQNLPGTTSLSAHSTPQQPLLAFGGAPTPPIPQVRVSALLIRSSWEERLGERML